jgi:hypothetical protein
MDLNIEGTGEVLGWSPPIGEVLSPGFKAVMEAFDFVSVSETKMYLKRLEEKGYCIAKYSPD